MRLPRPLWIKMGCGVSRFHLMEEGMACGLKRRMVESRSKNDLLDNHDNSTTSTTKLLLKEGSRDLAVGDSPSHHHLRKASSDSAGMKEPPMQPQIQEKECAEGEKGKCGLTRRERGMEKEECDETDDDEHERAEDNDFGRRISDFDGNWIGSPSFREYCVDSESDQDAVNHGRGTSGKDTEKKTQGTDNLESSNEVCVLPGPKHLEKKGSRGRKFIRVFPTMHRPKNLWHVTACYSRNNHHDLSGKLPEKEV